MTERQEGPPKMNFGNLVKTAFDATPSGQRLQQTKVSEQEQQQKQEQNERDFADYVQSRGARPVQNGMVHRDWTSGNGSVIPNAIFDKAGNEGRQVITHKDPTTGEKIQWELGTPDEQIAHQTALKLHQQMSEAPIRATAAQEATQNAGAIMGAQTTAQLGAQKTSRDTERETNGLTLPEVTRALIGIPKSGDGRRYLPEELSKLTEAGSNIQATQATADAKAQALLTGKQQRALQGLSSVQDQASYDQIRKDNPEGTADWPTLYNANTAKSLLKRAIPIEKQVELGIANLSDVDPQHVDQQVDALNLSPALSSRTKLMVRSAMARGDLKGAQAIVKDASDQMGRTETAVATAKATEPIKIDIASATDAAKLAKSGITEDDLQRAGTEYALTGVMPALGMSSGARSKILHYKEQFARDSGLSPKDLATAAAAYKGDSKSLENFQKQRDQIVSFEQTARKNLDLFLDAADKIPDTGVPWLNTPIRALDASVVGSANMAAVNAARQVANNEIAKVTSGGGLGGVLSDSARKEVSNYNPQNATFAQTKAVAKILKQDMQNRRESMDATLGEIKNRIGNPGGAGQPAKPTEPAKQYNAGDMVNYQGKPHKVVGYTAEGKLILE